MKLQKEPANQPKKLLSRSTTPFLGDLGCWRSQSLGWAIEVSSGLELTKTCISIEFSSCKNEHLTHRNTNEWIWIELQFPSAVRGLETCLDLMAYTGFSLETKHFVLEHLGIEYFKTNDLYKLLQKNCNFQTNFI